MVMQTILWHARATFLTWRSRTATDCALGQLIARIFLITEWALSRVHAAEESPADRRGQVLNVLTTELFPTECRAEALACTSNLLGRMAFVIASALVVRWPIRSAGAIPVQLPRRSLSSRWPCSFASCPRRRVPSSKRQRGCRHESVDARPAGVVGFDSPIVCPGAIAWDDTHRKALRQPKQTQLQSSRGRGSAPAPRPVQPSWSYLDVGCGNGAAARLVADTFGMHVVGVDVDPQQIALARNASGDRTDVLFMTADATCLPFEGRRFDIVATNKTTHHVPEWSSALAEMGRVLKPQRYLVYADLKTPLGWRGS
jgi:hypothetical protein